MTFPGTSGYSCPNCSAWVPIGVTHQCQGKSQGGISGGPEWTLSTTPDWTSLYLAQIVGLLVKIEEHLLHPLVEVDMTDIFGDRCMSATEIAAEVDAHFTKTNKEKAMAMSDVVSGVLLDALQNARGARRRAHSSSEELRTALGRQETALENAIVTIGEITNALVWGGIEVPPEAE